MEASVPTTTFSGGTIVRVLSALRIIHPFPTSLNVATTVALAAVALGELPPLIDALTLAAAMLCIQAAIGASNDYFDRELDAKTKPFKPIVRGLVKPRTALGLAAVLTIVAGSLTASMGWLPLLVGAIGALAGFGYNWRLKRSFLSPLPFMVALPALPVWVWVSLDVFTADLWWLLPFGPLIGLAVHLSNTAPDMEADRKAGVGGLSHRLGVDATVRIAWMSFAAAMGLAASLGVFLHYDWAILLPGLLVALAFLTAAISVYASRPTNQSLQLGFGLISIATAVVAGSWLAAIN